MAKSKFKIMSQIQYNIKHGLDLCKGFECDECPGINVRGGCSMHLKNWYNKQVKINQWKKLNK
jgi:hypothetical protein